MIYSFLPKKTMQLCFALFLLSQFAMANAETQVGDCLTGDPGIVIIAHVFLGPTGISWCMAYMYQEAVIAFCFFGCFLMTVYYQDRKQLQREASSGDLETGADDNQETDDGESENATRLKNTVKKWCERGLFIFVRLTIFAWWVWGFYVFITQLIIGVPVTTS